MLKYFLCFVAQNLIAVHRSHMLPRTKLNCAALTCNQRLQAFGRMSTIAEAGPGA